MTHEELVETIRANMLKQGKQAISSGFCEYRSYNGQTRLACAIGSIIPDDLYDVEIENRTVAGSVELRDGVFVARHISGCSGNHDIDNTCSVGNLKLAEILLALKIPKDNRTLSILRSAQRRHDGWGDSNWQTYWENWSPE